jgi:hypothetical protein
MMYLLLKLKGHCQEVNMDLLHQVMQLMLGLVVGNQQIQE